MITKVGSLVKGDLVRINDRPAIIEQIVIKAERATVRYRQSGIIVKTYLHVDSPVRRISGGRTPSEIRRDEMLGGLYGGR